LSTIAVKPIRLRRARLSLAFDARAAAWPAAVLALTAYAGLERAGKALGAPLWIDEGLSIGIARHPLGEIPGLLRQDGSPPVYYALLHWWMGIFGTSPSSTHALSVLFATLAVPACAWAAWRPFGPRAGLLAAALAAFSPFVGTYADETRMYSLAFLLAALATGAFLRAFVLGRRRWAVGFGVLMALLCLTHGWGLFYAAGAAVALLVALAVSPARRRLAIDALIAAGVAGVLFAPWASTFVFQSAHTGAPWSHVPHLRSVTRAVSRMLGSRAPETALLAVSAGGLLTARRRYPAMARSGLVAVAALAFVTLAGGYVASRLDQPVWALRYLAVPLAPLVVALGAGLDRAGATGVVVALVVCSLFWAGKPSAASLSNKSNVDALAAAVRGEVPPGTLVASPQPEQVPTLRYYLGPGLRYVTPLGVPADEGAMDWVDALRRLRHSHVKPTLGRAVAHLRPGQRVLLVVPRFGRADAKWTRAIDVRERRWRHWLERNRRLVEIDRYEPGRFASRATVAGVLYQRLAHRYHRGAGARAALDLLPAHLRRDVRRWLRAFSRGRRGPRGA
jgi:mannosyltransferase